MANTKIPVELSSTPSISDSGDATAITIDSSENVGIGASSPQSRLEIAPPDNSTANKIIFSHFSARGDANDVIAGGIESQFRTRDSNVNTGAFIRILDKNTNSSYPTQIRGGEIVFGTIDGATGFANNPAVERMRIDTTGALLVGTTSQITASTEECVHIKNGDGAGQLFLDNTRSSGNQFMVQIYRLGTRVGSIQTSTTGTSYLETSDYRLKENVDYDFNALERVAQLKPARFNFIKEPDETVDGFLAHEVSPVVPQAVSGEKDAVKEEEYEITPAEFNDYGDIVTEAVMGTREVPDLQGIDHSKLVPLLTKAIQELSAKVEELESKIE